MRFKEPIVGEPLIAGALTPSAAASTLLAVHVAVTAVGQDRPGIAAAVTQVLYEHGCNIEDSRMAILGGQFAMMLIVATNVAPASLEHVLSAATASLDLIVAVRPVAETPAESSDGDPFVLSVYGADHPGIVYRVTAALAARGVNVTDLATRVLDGDPPVYLMIMELTLPPGADVALLEADLMRLKEEVGVDVTLRPAEADTL